MHGFSFCAHKNTCSVRSSLALARVVCGGQWYCCCENYLVLYGGLLGVKIVWPRVRRRQADWERPVGAELVRL